jgi:hypothetical protein
MVVNAEKRLKRGKKKMLAGSVRSGDGGRYKGGLAVSSASLKGRRQDPYDRNQWTSTHHFHVPYGTQVRNASLVHIFQWRSFLKIF